MTVPKPLRPGPRASSRGGVGGGAGGWRERGAPWALEQATGRPPPVPRGPSIARCSEARWGALEHKLRGTRGKWDPGGVAARRLDVRGSAESLKQGTQPPRVRSRHVGGCGVSAQGSLEPKRPGAEGPDSCASRHLTLRVGDGANRGLSRSSSPRQGHSRRSLRRAPRPGARPAPRLKDRTLSVWPARRRCGAGGPRCAPASAHWPSAPALRPRGLRALAVGRGRRRSCHVHRESDSGAPGEGNGVRGHRARS